MHPGVFTRVESVFDVVVPLPCIPACFNAVGVSDPLLVNAVRRQLQNQHLYSMTPKRTHPASLEFGCCAGGSEVGGATCPRFVSPFAADGVALIGWNLIGLLARDLFLFR